MPSFFALAEWYVRRVRLQIVPPTYQSVGQVDLRPFASELPANAVDVQKRSTRVTSEVLSTQGAPHVAALYSRRICRLSCPLWAGFSSPVISERIKPAA